MYATVDCSRFVLGPSEAGRHTHTPTHTHNTTTLESSFGAIIIVGELVKNVESRSTLYRYERTRKKGVSESTTAGTYIYIYMYIYITLENIYTYMYSIYVYIILCLIVRVYRSARRGRRE